MPCLSALCQGLPPQRCDSIPHSSEGNEPFFNAGFTVGNPIRELAGHNSQQRKKTCALRADRIGLDRTGPGSVGLSGHIDPWACFAKSTKGRGETPMVRKGLARLWDCGMDAESINKRRENSPTWRHLVLVAVAETTTNYHDVHTACTTLPRDH
jgi:hypothetical protein